MLSTLILLLFSTESFSAKNICPSYKNYQKKIYNCGQNKILEEPAEKCFEKLKTKAKKTGKELDKLFSELETKIASNQKYNQKDVSNRLRDAIKKLENQIKELQVNATAIEKYPKGMIDIPNSTSAETSLGCFNKTFDFLQNILTQMDQEILNSKKARIIAIELLNRAGVNYTNADNISKEEYTNILDSSKKQLENSQTDDGFKVYGLKKRKFLRKESDISGTKEENK
ncbi:MAG: hypothetical protein M9962_12620 [Oligoflexia bacterium]|nr:hypothetical protein [Oligoflexia bacterium]